VFNSDREGDESLFLQRLDGGSAERLIQAEKGIRPQADAWSPDGKILIVTNRLGGISAGGSGGISMLSLGTDPKPTLIVKPPAMNASLSPDGKWLAYSEQSPRTQIYVEPFPPTGEKHQITRDGGQTPLWSPDGKELFYVSTTGTFQIMAVAVETRPSFLARQTTPLPIEIYAPGSLGTGSLAGTRSYDITPDGKDFVVMLPKSRAETDQAPPEQINITLNWFEELKQRVPVH
jgi:Tol biopolymer transport system component